MQRQSLLKRLTSWLMRRFRSTVGPAQDTGSLSDSRFNETERLFHTTFHMLPGPRKLGLIDYYQRRHKCSRTDAMQRAIEDRARDNGYRM